MITDIQKETYKENLKKNKKLTKKAMKKFKIIYIFAVLTGFVLGFGFIAIDAMLEKKGISIIEGYGIYFILGFVLYFVFLIAHIIIHEAGHLVCGLKSGYQFLSFRIFSLTLVKKDGKVHKRKYKISGTAGQCLMYPPEKNADGSFPYALYNLGGGLANLITSLPFVILAICVNDAIVRTFSISFALSGILLAITNLIPMDVGIQNDGLNLVSISKDNYIRDSFYQQLKINAEMSNGKEITEYDSQIFIVPEGKNDTNMITASNRFLLYYWFLAKQDFDSAYEELTKITEKLGEYSLATYNMAQAERLFFMVLQHKPICEIAALYYRIRYTLIKAKTDIGIQRIRYTYEALLTEDEKKDIMCLIMKKNIKKWKPTDLDKLYKDISKTAENFPVAGEAKMHMDILNYCVF